ncbi:2-C-methyl-D-erythritol 2,4-cyclodiphosphate synthase [Tepidiphilus baoligensis]|uniref:2-C-methyl-D-erythritol 2,4-cyclodiphosphate synthase n=1 Tax=Tepidiphilus baoligensis TaxID=2698687 RepID=A0ABX1QM73_9PROT|nr:2-C-methyl-D-erythritol 2,4-cyclodiphosphate synthase [Tepidiphilus baoligensis]NMH16314.1 2-C-methyl-D-erythritol 2,4-cyclodiphosphate synthase [Tepidiphilus baoligensis]
MIRVGLGFDVHALVPGRRCVIGGVEIVHAEGLLGHSDADVLLHAVTDAVLGAAGLGDIGSWFPDSDARHAGADSRELLAQAWAAVRAAGWRLGNLDAVVICRRPRIAPWVPQMKATIAGLLDAPPAAIQVKGKTTEGLGFTGRGEGVAAQVVVLLEGEGGRA